MKHLKNVVARIRLLVTGHAVWVEVATGKETVEHLPWRIRWTLVGVHARNWWWVKRWGKQACGCTINPVTRHRVRIDGNCREHFGPARARPPISERRKD